MCRSALQLELEGFRELSGSMGRGTSGGSDCTPSRRIAGGLMALVANRGGSQLTALTTIGLEIAVLLGGAGAAAAGWRRLSAGRKSSGIGRLEGGVRLQILAAHHCRVQTLGGNAGGSAGNSESRVGLILPRQRCTGHRGEAK